MEREEKEEMEYYSEYDIDMCYESDATAVKRKHMSTGGKKVPKFPKIKHENPNYEEPSKINELMQIIESKNAEISNLKHQITMKDADIVFINKEKDALISRWRKEAQAHKKLCETMQKHIMQLSRYQ